MPAYDQIVHGSLWTLRKAIDDLAIPVGEPLLVLGLSEDGKVSLRYFSGENKNSSYDIQVYAGVFLDACANTPAVLQDLQSELVTGPQPCALIDGPATAQQPDVASVLVTAPSRAMAVSHNLSHHLEASEYAMVETERRLNQIQQINEAQHSIMRRRMEAMQKDLRRVRTAMQGINVYLGVGEQIVDVKMGERAPDSSPLVIRQLILFADEECAITNDGGIDFRQLNLFDRWLVDNIDQILPNPRSICAMRTRRKEKQYSDETTDAFTRALNNQANRESFFILRSGENIWRIHPEFNLNHETLFPTAVESKAMLCEEELIGDDGKPCFPGDYRWARAVEKAEFGRQEMLVTIMFLQGLLDRTDLVGSLPVHVENIIMPPPESIQYMRDAEMLLGDGRPSFNEWRQAINAHTRAGSRIVGSFKHGHGDHINVRTHQWEKWPRHDQIFTVSKCEEGPYHSRILHFQFQSTFQEWKNGTKQKTGTKTCTFKFHDSSRHYINYDHATVEDARYYLSNRMHRHEYLEMFPVLKALIAAKNAEDAAENQFVALLVEKHGAKDGHARELVQWWKFKNKYRRGLTTDDTKAWRMIINQAEKAAAREKDAALCGRDAVVEAITTKTRQVSQDAPMYIGYAGDGTFVSLVPSPRAPAGIHVFDEYFWRRTTDDQVVVPGDQAVFQTSQWRHALWTQLWSDDRWSKWDHLADTVFTILPNEHEELAQRALTVADTYCQLYTRERHRRGQRSCHEDVRIPISVFVDEKDHCIRIAVMVKHGLADAGHPCTHPASRPAVFMVSVRFHRPLPGQPMELAGPSVHEYPSFVAAGFDSRKWTDWHGSSEKITMPTSEDENCLWFDKAAYDLWVSETQAYIAVSDARDTMEESLRDIKTGATQWCVDHDIDIAHQAFTAKRGSQTAWKTREKELRSSLSNRYHLHEFQSVIERLAEECLLLKDMSIDQAYGVAAQLLLAPRTEEEKCYWPTWIRRRHDFQGVKGDGETIEIDPALVAAANVTIGELREIGKAARTARENENRLCGY